MNKFFNINNKSNFNPIPFIVLMVAITLVLASILYIFIMEAFTEDELETQYEEVSGFDKNSILNAPIMTSISLINKEQKPQSTAFIQPRYSYDLDSYLHNNSVYVKAGSIMTIYMENTGDNDIFVYSYGIELEWLPNQRFESEVGYTISAYESILLGNISFPGPDQNGYYNYKVGISFMVKNKISRWYDFGWRTVDEHTIEVKPLIDKVDYLILNNPKKIFNKIQTLLKDDEYTIEKAKALTKSFGSELSIYKYCRLYDFVSTEIEYVSDGEDIDIWSSPDETLSRRTGDCEDSAILLGVLIKAIGGTVRMNDIRGHMFASFYAGSEYSLKSIMEGISNYYNIKGSLTHVAYYTDEFGNWIMFDPVVYDYLGACPIGGGPVKTDSSSGFIWDFVETDHHYIIDVIN